MDPEAWRELADALNERPCPFAQAILSGSAQCAGAERLCIGERQALQCRLDQDQARCRGLFQALRQQARFALRSVDPSAALHHHQSLRLQIGGLRGLGAALDAGHIEPQVIQDIRPWSPRRWRVLGHSPRCPIR